jgi:general secretion pathway protein H
MSIIEILVVLAIIGLLLEVAAAAMGPVSQAETVRATNQLVSTIRFAYDRARVYGFTVRIEIDLEKGTFSLQQTDSRLYLPATDRDGKNTKFDAEKQKRQDDRDRAAAESFNSSLARKAIGSKAVPASSGTSTAAAGAAAADDAGDPYAVEAQQVPRARPPLFSSFENENALPGLGQPIELPADVKVVSVRTDSDPEEITTGKAYIYFFPGGRTQLAHISLRHVDNDDAFTLKVAPLTGKVVVIPEIEALRLPDDAVAGVDDLGRKIERRSF